MIAVYRHRSSEKEQECETVREAENGVFLVDSYGDDAGYIPYDSLQFVIPEHDEGDE